MIIDFRTCPLTGREKMENEIIDVVENPLLIRYKNRTLGEVVMPITLFTMLEGGKYKEVYPIIVGIIREYSFKSNEPFKLTTQFVDHEYKNYTYPKDFDEKAKHFLNYLFENGGKEYKSFRILPDFDYSLAFALNKEEFCRILDKLEDEDLIEFTNKARTESGEIVSADIKLTRSGIAEF